MIYHCHADSQGKIDLVQGNPYDSKCDVVSEVLNNGFTVDVKAESIEEAVAKASELFKVTL